MKIGQKLHINRDDAQWGRIASDATVVDIIMNRFVLLDVEQIRATICVKKEELEYAPVL